MILLLEEIHTQAIMKHSNSVFPIETCGVPTRIAKTQIRIIKRIEAAQNRTHSSRSYTIAPEESHRILTQSEERGESLVGFYHSHPS